MGTRLPAAPAGDPQEGHMKIFGREPVVWLGAIAAVLAVIVTIPDVGLTAEAAGWIMTIVSGVFAAAEAIMTRPFVVTALTGAVRTVITGFVFFGLPLTEETSGAIVAALNMVLMLVLANSVTPAADPAPGFVRAQNDVAA
ncbi:hypothetical protein ACIBCT_21305 [Streptosporangium sp. NPDC050855]|uniref:hypothetical protein n=1 Tax=Streptosporangium sp. NPDC050855 TaxID=3366194 RepID=UPI0037B27F22